MDICRRFPGWKQVTKVYAVIVLMIYSWTILWFFWKLPSWLFFLNAGEIFVAGAYAFVLSLVESVTVLCPLVVACMILPLRWFHDRFVARGSVVVLSGLSYTMFIASKYQTNDDFPSLYIKPWSVAVALAAMLLIVVFSEQIAIVRKAVEVLADHATVFLYIYMPLSIAALLVVFVRWVM